MHGSRITAALAVICLGVAVQLVPAGPRWLPLPVGAGPAAAQVQLNLRDADLTSFIEIVSEATGRRFVLDAGVRGSVTVLAPGTLAPDDLYEVFLAVLELNRLTVVEGPGADRIVPLNLAREMASGAAAAGPPQGFETRVIAVENVPAGEILDVVRPLIPPEAVISAVAGSNLLILSDRAANQARIAALIERLDVPRTDPIEVVRLRNADADEVLQVVQSMGIVPDGAAVTLDRRSNALVIRGPEDVRERVRLLAARLDTQRDSTVSQAVSLRYADAAGLAAVVLQAVGSDGGEGAPAGSVRIVPDVQSNSLLVSAPEDRVGEILNMIEYLDRRPTQVLVEAVIFEMSVESFADLSVQFGAVLNNAVVGGAQFSLPGRQTLTGAVSAALNGTTPDLGSGGVLAGGQYDGSDGIIGLVSAVASKTSTRLLSTPSILTLNNQEAEIVVAQNVPFVTGSYSTTDGGSAENPFQTIERQDVGLTLTVTPQISADRTVRLEIRQEVSNLTNSTSSSGGEITAKRALSTTVLVRDGNVVLLGGLLENGSGTVAQRVPGLSELPLVGGLFRGKNASKNQRVLLVLLRPQVVATDHEAEQLTRRIAVQARTASIALAPADDGRYPRSPGGTLPFDGVDLNQPFDAGFVDDVAQSRNFPPLPSRLRFAD